MPGSQSRDSVASPTNTMNPTTSVAVVSTTLLAITGSIYSRRIISGVPGSRIGGSSTERYGHVEDGRCPVETAIKAGEGDGLPAQVQRNPGRGELDAVISSKSECPRIFSRGFNDMLTYLGDDQGRPIPGKGYPCAVDGGLV